MTIILDTETTALIDSHLIPLDKQPEIIELYMVDADLDTGEIKREFDSLFKPKKLITEETTRITGIDNETVAGAGPISMDLDRIAAFIESGDGVCAHNLSYDMEMIDIEFEREGKKVAWPRRKLCTVEATVHLKGFRLNLTGLHELLFNEKFPEAHRAKNDVMALTRCAIELRKRGEI